LPFKAFLINLSFRYADAEKRCIDLNQKINLLQSKLNDSSKEKLHLNERLVKFKIEIEKLNLDYDQRIKDIIKLKKDNEQVKEQLVLNDAKEKAGYIKYKNELELHNATKRMLEEANLKISELSTKLNEIRSDESETIASSTSVVSSSNDTQIITVATDSLSINADVNNSPSISPTPNSTTIGSRTLEKDKTIRELYALKSQLKDMFEERTSLRDKLQCMEQERKLQEVSFNRYKETLQSQKQMNKELLNEILQLRELQETLTK